MNFDGPAFPWLKKIGIATVLVGVGSTAYAQSLTALAPVPPAWNSEAIDVRYRSFNRTSDLQEFVGDNLSSQSGRSQAYVNPLNYSGVANPFSISYDATRHVISTTLDGQTISYNWTPTQVDTELRVSLKTTASSANVISTVSIGELVLNSVGLGATPVAVSSAGTASATWSIAGAPGYDFGQGFSLTGNLYLSDKSTFSGSAEASKVDFYLGTSGGTPVPETSTWAAIGFIGLAVGGGLMRRLR